MALIGSPHAGQAVAPWGISRRHHGIGQSRDGASGVETDPSSRGGVLAG